MRAQHRGRGTTGLSRCGLVMLACTVSRYVGMVGTRMQCLVWLDRPQRRLPSRHTQGNLSAGKIGKKEKEEAGRVAFCRHRGSDKVSSAEQAVRWFTDLTLLICVSGKRHRWRAVAEGRVDDVMCGASCAASYGIHTLSAQEHAEARSTSRSSLQSMHHGRRAWRC